MTSENQSDKEEGAGPEGESPKKFLREKKTDESWKEKARQEKEKLAGTAGAGMDYELPPASFTGLLEELSMRALFALGQVPDPATGEVHLDLVAARYAIDVLGVLEEKTKGNLDRMEAASLKSLLQRLRLAFVEISRQVAATGAGAAHNDAPEGMLDSAPGGKQTAGKRGAGEEKPGPKIIL